MDDNDPGNELRLRINRLFGDWRDWRQGETTEGLVVIGNGAVKQEGGPVAQWVSIEEVSDRTLFTIGSLFPHAKTQRVIWRRYPQLENYQEFGPPCHACGNPTGPGVFKQKITIRIGVEPL